MIVGVYIGDHTLCLASPSFRFGEGSRVVNGPERVATNVRCTLLLA